MVIEFEDKIILNKDEKKFLSHTLKEILSSYENDPKNINTYIDRLTDDISNILKGREWSPAKTKRRKPEDEGDHPDGGLCVTVKDYDEEPE